MPVASPVPTDPGPPRPRWRLGPTGQRRFDVLLVVGLLLPVATYVPLGLYATETLLALAQLVPLLWRRTHPVTVFAVMAGASALQALLVDTPLWNQVAFPVATYAVARYARPLWALVALLVGFCGAGVAAYVWLRGLSDGVSGPVTLDGWIAYTITVATIVIASWALGSLARVRSAYEDSLVERGRRLEAEATQRAELAAADERARIAREMHDVVAHGLSVIVVQADGARYAAAQEPRLATEALETIAITGREALTEMRRMLGLLRGGPEAGTPDTRPQPRLVDLAALVDEARAGGMTVSLTMPDPLPSVPDGVALTAYRVVQEALTNVRKHAGPGATARVAVGLLPGRPGTLSLVVEDDGRGAAADDDGRGLGLLGMRERVAVHGGDLDAGPRLGGGFTVSARIPL
ncbi:sensor histidine kinase [Nocardioides ferulae]|uniref:sensor histidine kinase n=1 Tax=Nocardioides ferulae TaxID=2340821 RepID=UPI000EB08399|nr:sensor histidine kinase [Nocardioides ferulae]